MLKFYENNIEFLNEEFIESLQGNGYFVYYTQNSLYDDDVMLTLDSHIFESYDTIIICNENLKIYSRRNILASIRSKGKRKPEILFSYNDLVENGQRVESWDIV
jgi:hypothetical protein